MQNFYKYVICKKNLQKIFCMNIEAKVAADLFNKN